MAAPLKISARVEIDANPAKQGAAASVAAVDTIGAAAERNTTKLQAMIAASVGLKSGAANQNVREWSGALTMQGKSIDELRAKYNPLFATIGQYKAALVEIRTLHAQGVLSTNEMTAAIQRQRQAALASIDAIKGRSSVLHAGMNADAGFRRQNLGYQIFDIGQGVSSGMPAGMIAAQQLPQIAQIYAGQGGGIKALLADVGTLATGAVTAIGAMPLALAAAGAAAILYDRNVSSAAANAQKAFVKHEEALQRIKTLFDESGSASERYGQRVQNAISFTARSDTRGLEETLALQTKAAGTELLNAVPRGSGAAMANLYGPYLAAVQHFIAEARQGRGDVAAFNEEVIRIGNDNQADARVQRIGQKLLDVTQAATDTAGAIKKLNDEFARTSISTARTDAALTMTQYRIQNADALAAIRRTSTAELDGLRARSPAELAEAARARVRAEPVDPRESVEVRTARENAAATLAQAQAERQLAEARRERSRSLDQTLGQQQLELSLIGKTVGEQERLRMQFRLTAELKAEAARNGTQIDAAELARVQQLSAEYGKLAEQMVARRALDGQDQELAALRVRLSLVGQTEDVRTLAIANLETERRLRELGIALGSREAAQYREKAQLIAVQTEQLRKQEAAWETIRSTGENTIDTLFDKLSDGDWKGALEDIAKDWSKTILQLGAANPLKNAWLGTNLPTLDDVGGLGGMFSRLFGGGMSTASMSVNAATVSINGGLAGGLGGLLGAGADFKPSTTLSSLLGYGGAANDNGKTASIFPATDVASYIRQAATARGIDPSVALAVARSEGGLSSWNLQSSVIRNGVREPSFGPYQLYMNGGLGNAFQRQTGLDPRLAANGPAGVDFALDYASKNGWGSWYGARNTGISNWQGIGAGGSASAQHSLWSGIESKGTAAVASLDKLAGKSGIAADGLGSLGSGFDQFGKNLTNLFPAAPSGGSGGGFFSKLFGGLFGGLSSYGSSIASSSAQFASAWSLGGIGLFAKGGVADEPSIFGEAGPEAAVPLPDGRTIPVTLNVRQAYRTPQAANYGGGASSGGGRIVINNYSSAKVEAEESTDERGARQTVFTISEVVGAAVAQKGGKAGRTMEQQYGLRRRGINR